MSLGRVAFETSFDSKQPKLESKLVSALSETKPLFRLFRCFNWTETETEEKPKQFDRKHILLFFSENLGLCRFVSVCFGLLWNSLFRLFCFYIETEFRCFNVSIELKQTEGQPKQFDREHILVFFENLGLFGFVSKQFYLFQCFNKGSKHRNKLKQTKIFCFCFHETKRNTPETDLVSVCLVWTKFFVCLFRGHPISGCGIRNHEPNWWWSLRNDKFTSAQDCWS